MQRKRLMSRQKAGQHAGAILGGLGVLFSLCLPAAADDSAAHAIADKFSGAPAERRSEENRRAAERQRLKTEAEALERAKAEELEMLAKARRESEERVALERRRREEAEISQRLRNEEAARVAAEAEARKVAGERAAREAEERRLAQERRERDRLAAEAEARRVEEARKAEADRAAREAEERRVADEQRQRVEDEREAEARRIVEKHNRAREAREQRVAEQPLAPSAPPPQTAEGDDIAQPGTDLPETAVKEKDTRATVLLVMEPGTRGIRKGAPTADPVLCSGLVCYVSMGPGHLSQALARPAVLGPINTLSRRAWACQHKLACVFRSVDMSSGRVTFQPIDLRIMRHDRRESLTAELDSSCEVVAGRLTCSKPLRAASWRAWIVPESVAKLAGPDVLEAAVKAGLPDTRSALWR